MTVTAEDVQKDWIASLKSKSAITSLLHNGAEEVRATEYQSTQFYYNNIRVGVDFTPSINGCGPDDAIVHVEIFSDEKSWKEAIHIAGLIQTTYHKKTLSINNRRYSTIVVRKYDKPDRSIYAWVIKMQIFVQVAG